MLSLQQFVHSTEAWIKFYGVSRNGSLYETFVTWNTHLICGVQTVLYLPKFISNKTTQGGKSHLRVWKREQEKFIHLYLNFCNNSNKKLPRYILTLFCHTEPPSTNNDITINLKSLMQCPFNPLNPELNPICYLLALLGSHHFLHVSRIRVKLLTIRRLMSYIYGAPILDVSRSHTTTQHSR